jgi:hypothetical protein
MVRRQVSSRIEKWTDRVLKDGLVEFAIGYLQHWKVDLPVDNRRRPATSLTRREELAEMVTDVRVSKDGELRFRLLQDAVRQKRASLAREKDKRSIKRLDLKDSVCAKLESLSRATRLRQSTLVENLITDEAAVRRSESATLKSERQKVNEDSKRVREKEAELKARDAELKIKEVELSRREGCFSQRLARLAAFDALLDAITECETDDLDVKINIDPGGSVENLLTFSAAEGSSDSVKSVADAWDEVLSHLGGDSALS